MFTNYNLLYFICYVIACYVLYICENKASVKVILIRENSDWPYGGIHTDYKVVYRDSMGKRFHGFHCDENNVWWVYGIVIVVWSINLHAMP